MSPLRLLRALPLGLLLLPAALGAADAPDALDRLNAAFRATYRDAKARQLQGTVIVVNGDQALLLRDGARVAEAEVRPLLYHRLKAVDHVALALHLELLGLDDGPLPDAARTRLAGLRGLTAQARAELGARPRDPVGQAGSGDAGSPASPPQPGARASVDRLPGAPFPPGAVLARQGRILDRSLAAVDAVLKSGRGARTQAGALARDLAPDLMANVHDAAALQLEALHRAVSGWRKAMPPAAWDGVRVVLMGAHMPRQEEVTWQYFSRLLAQPREGDRIIYAEGLWELKDALDLLATHGVDRGLGAAFFGEPERMHRDLLADGARDWLDANLPR